MKRGKLRTTTHIELYYQTRSQRATLNEIEENHSGISYSLPGVLYDRLSAIKVPIKKVENILNFYKLGLDMKSEDTPFNRKKVPNLKESKFLNVENIDILRESGRFSVPFFNGMGIFCSLFLQDIQSNTNLLSLENFSLNTARNPDHNKAFNLDPKWGGEPLKKAFLKTFYFLSGIKIDETYGFSNLAKDSDKWLQNLLNLNPDNEFLKSISHKYNQNKSEKIMANVTEFTFDQLMKEYLTGLMKKYYGSQTNAAKAAGLKYETFRSKFDKYCKVTV